MDARARGRVVVGAARRTLRLVVVGVLVAGCSGGSSGRSRAVEPTTTSSSTIPAPREVRIRLVLPARLMRSGSSQEAFVAVSNGSGGAFTVTGCGAPFQVLLVRSGSSPRPAWPSCAERIRIPKGESRYTVTVRASYDDCSVSTPLPSDAVACLPDRTVPPLPPGRYQATIFQQPTIGTTTRPIGVRVLPALDG